MPTAHADAAATPQGVPVTLAVLGNDAGEGELAIVGYTEPGNGTLRLNPDRSFTYTPALGFFGEDGFTYTVRDAAGDTATGTVTVTVTRPNLPPLPGDDAARTAAGEGGVVIPVLDNDADPDGDALALVAVETPGHGTVQVEPGGENLRYTPQAGFVGTDSFAYTVSDGWGGTATASVTVAVEAPNTAPAATEDRVTTQPGTPVTIDALANDDDPEGGPLTLAGLTMPAHGTLTLTPEQRFVYAPDPGFVGSDGFTYTVRDAGGLQAEGRVVVEVAPRNAPPTAIPDSFLLTDGLPLRLDLLANDNDPDGDPLRLTALTLPTAGRLAVNPDRSVTYTPAPGFAGTDGFTYRVGDGTFQAEAEVTVEVIPPAAAGRSFANGYRYRRRLVVVPPAAADAAATVVQDVVLLVRETQLWLRSAANGGQVESEQGFDLRFEAEADGTKLDHELERYDPATGELVAWVRLPGWRLAEPFELALYHGRPGLPASEANPAGTWRGYLAVWDTRTGADRSGQGRDLQPVNVAADGLIAGCGRFDGNAVARRADASFLSGLEALTVQAMLVPEPAMAGSDHGFLAQGPMTGDDAAAGLSLGYLARSPGGAARVVAFRLRRSGGIRDHRRHAVRHGRRPVLGGGLCSSPPRDGHRPFARRHHPAPLRLGGPRVSSISRTRWAGGPGRGRMAQGSAAHAARGTDILLFLLCRVPVRPARPWRRDPALLRSARRAAAGDHRAEGETSGAACGGRAGHRRRPGGDRRRWADEHRHAGRHWRFVLRDRRADVRNLRNAAALLARRAYPRGSRYQRRLPALPPGALAFLRLRAHQRRRPRRKPVAAHRAGHAGRCRRDLSVYPLDRAAGRGPRSRISGAGARLHHGDRRPRLGRDTEPRADRGLRHCDARLLVDAKEASSRGLKVPHHRMDHMFATAHTRRSAARILGRCDWHASSRRISKQFSWNGRRSPPRSLPPARR
jgi:hypothetical protein